MIDWFIYGILGAVFTFCVVMALMPKKKIICSLSGIGWTMNKFCHNFMIVGAIGSGKTVCVENILHQLLLNVKNCGIFWMDNKGDSHESLFRITKKHNRQNDVSVLEVPFEGRTLYSEQRLNLLTIPGIGPHITAMILADIASRADSKATNAGFFRTQTIRHIAKGIKFLEHKKKKVTMFNLHDFLCSRDRMLEMCAHQEQKDFPERNPDGTVKMVTKTVWVPDEDPHAEHWHTHYLSQGTEQLSGVTSSIDNALSPFLEDSVARVFSSELADTVDFNDISKGKIFCVICPHTLPREKECINQYFKSLFFYTGKMRYDRRRFHKKSEENLLVAFIDEYQQSAATTDKNFLDTLRAANCSFVAAMQDDCSLTPAVGEAAPTILGQFRNRIFFRSLSPESAKNASAIFGERRIWKISHGSSGCKSSSNRSEADEFILRPPHFLCMKDTYCAILSTDRKIRKRTILPLV